MPFHVQETGFEGLVLIKPDIFRDERGFFLETWNQRHIESLGFQWNFIQDNLAKSKFGTLRGLHFQAPPFAQAKYVMVLYGKVLDVVVDIRLQSNTYGKHYSVILDADDPRILFVPEGFAHGYAVLSEECLFSYKCVGFYNKEAEGGLKWNDPDLDIDWMIENPILSEKDNNLPLFKDFLTPFIS
jgi:dTDP-4-dehydrorhamnose 3,5-epimerase